MEELAEQVASIKIINNQVDFYVPMRKHWYWPFALHQKLASIYELYHKSMGGFP
jgi:hypothetical protein